jgi:diguanylate cyclase (GGDEF)-like protein
MDNQNRDSLTGLSNKRALDERFHQLAIQPENQFSLMLIDVDRLIWFNDKYGHLEGDNLLATIGQIIDRVIPSSYEAFRSGGEEFVILTAQTDRQEVVGIAELIRRNVAEKHSAFLFRTTMCSYDCTVSTYIETSPSVTCSIVFYPKHGQDLIHLLKVAKNVMYEGAKQLGGNKVAIAGEKVTILSDDI